MKNTLIGVCILVIGLVIGFCIPHKGKTHVITTTDTIYQNTTDTITITEVRNKVVYKPILDTIHITDTIEVLREFYSTVAIDTNFTINECDVVMNERISKNNVQSLIFQVTNNRATAINKTVVIPKPTMFIGGVVGGILLCLITE